MKFHNLLKLLGLSILCMVTLIALSFLEVTIYSYLINPGMPMDVYEAHAQSSAPFVSGIFGFIIFFLVARYWTKKRINNSNIIVFAFPLTYILLDILVLSLVGLGATNLSSLIWIFLLANGLKFLGSYLGYKSVVK